MSVEERYSLGLDLGAVARRHSRVLVQAPDGLKRLARRAVEELEGMGVEAFLSAGHAWGGCDIAFGEARAVGATAILHIGHHGPVRTRMPGDVEVFFAPAYYTGSPLPAVEEALGLLEGRRVAVASTIQHIGFLGEVKRLLAEKGFEPVTGTGPLGVEGLVIGCDYTALDVDADSYLIVAGGMFHGVGAAVWKGRPVAVADPYTGAAALLDGKKIVARHLYGLSEALGAEELLIVVSTKPGQYNMRGAEAAARMLRSAGRRAHIAVMEEVRRETLENLGGYDAYINSACPRLGLDDPELFPGLVVNLGETRYLLSRSLGSWRPRDAFRLHP